jgi:hypothetical protein
VSPLQPGAATTELHIGSQEAPPLVLYYRSEVVLRIKLDDGDEKDSGLVPHRATWHDGGHKRATEIGVDIHGSVLPFPLEHIASVFCSLFQGAADGPEDDIKTQDNLCFCGYFEDVEVDEETRVVTFKARDLSALLRDHKPLVTVKTDDGRTIDPTPRYEDTVGSAIRRILSVVPGFFDDRIADALATLPLTSGLSIYPPLRLRDVDALDIRLDTFVTGRRAKKGPISLPSNCSAWDAIEVVAGLTARMVGVELAELRAREGK